MILPCNHLNNSSILISVTSLASLSLTTSGITTACRFHEAWLACPNSRSLNPTLSSHDKLPGKPPNRPELETALPTLLKQ